MHLLTKTVGRLHQRLVKPRQSQCLVDYIVKQLPEQGKVLDIGCGTGKISRMIAERNPKLSIEGIDILAQPDAEIPVKVFDGSNIPFDDKTFDAAVFVDVLHHTDEYTQLLNEALRVSKGPVIIKDHICKTRFAFVILAFMDWVGNESLGIRSIYNYYSEAQWKQLFDDVGITKLEMTAIKGLYPFPFNLVFERNKQVIFHLSAMAPAVKR